MAEGACFFDLIWLRAILECCADIFGDAIKGSMPAVVCLCVGIKVAEDCSDVIADKPPVLKTGDKGRLKDGLSYTDNVMIIQSIRHAVF
jgi:hypothetical protein